MSGCQEAGSFTPFVLINTVIVIFLFPLPPFLLFHFFFCVCAAQDFLSSAALDGPSLNKALCASSRARLSFQVGASNWPRLRRASCMCVGGQ